MRCGFHSLSMLPHLSSYATLPPYLYLRTAQNTKADVPLIRRNFSDVDFEVVHQQPEKLFQAVQQSRDKLFFVSF
jgi:hypothetical protein